MNSKQIIVSILIIIAVLVIAGYFVRTTYTPTIQQNSESLPKNSEEFSDFIQNDPVTKEIQDQKSTFTQEISEQNNQSPSNSNIESEKRQEFLNEFN